MTSKPSAVGPEALERVFAALEHEADLDGVSTASERRLGELAGLSHAAAGFAVRRLAEQGRVSVVGRVGRGGTLEVRLSPAGGESDG